MENESGKKRSHKVVAQRIRPKVERIIPAPFLLSLDEYKGLDTRESILESIIGVTQLTRLRADTLCALDGSLG